MRDSQAPEWAGEHLAAVEDEYEAEGEDEDEDEDEKIEVVEADLADGREPDEDLGDEAPTAGGESGAGGAGGDVPPPEKTRRWLRRISTERTNSRKTCRSTR